MSETLEPILVPEDHDGEPGFAHGGWFMGRLADALDGVVRVTLRARPPLGVPVLPTRAGDGLLVHHEGELIAEAVPGSVDWTPGPLPDMETARIASADFEGDVDHPFPSCFGCGPLRPGASGLRIFPGPLSRGGVAGPWTPPPSAGEASGRVRGPVLWAALACPAGWAVRRLAGLSDDETVVIGGMRLSQDAPVRVGERLIISAFPLDPSPDPGPVRGAASVLHDPDGGIRARAVSSWRPAPRRG